MKLIREVVFLGAATLLTTAAARADEPKVLTNHVGYETSGPKHAVVLGSASDNFTTCALKDNRDSRTLLTVPAQHTGPVKKWREWHFWTVDFDSFSTEGTFYLLCSSGDTSVRSFPFAIRRLLLEQSTLSDVIYFFKEERSTGRMDQADHRLPFDGSKKGMVDAHGGWWDATGDYGKHLSHLSFSTYFNPQQSPLVAYSLFKSQELLNARGVPEFLRYKDRMLDEAMYGADYLVRLRVPGGSFYRSVSTGGVKQVPEERKIAGEMKRFGIYQSSDKSPRDTVEQASSDLEYEASYRSGAGVAVAALAIASTYPFSGEFSSDDYRKAAVEAFDYLETNNLEFYRATKKDVYKAAADRRAASLIARLTTSGYYVNYWRADDGDRPFFHASDAGLPAVSLLYYAQIATPEMKSKVLDAVKKSLLFQLTIMGEVANPFGYAREFTQDKTGNRRTSFFFPHNSDAAPWWQGENARLASLAAAANLAAPNFPDDSELQKKLANFSANQLNWILGLNPFDACMLNGVHQCSWRHFEWHHQRFPRRRRY